ncbi:hypothetical protein ACFY1P_20625 [Streptomyces sp. NPDC001407]|uniref:hypothetical protein n=1 Tax=Streptomyces sp. NPDC001407 TaxID=3364573 RepID=UPI003682E2A5
MFASVPKGWEALLAPVAMVWGRLDRLAARLTVQAAVRRELGLLDGLFGPGRGMVILGARLRRRAAELGRRPVKDPVGWLVGWAIPRRAVCPDVRCDDGRRMDTGAPCERCAEHLGDLVARRREVGLQLASGLAEKAPAGEYLRRYETRLREVTRRDEQRRAERREQAALEQARQAAAWAERRAEQEVLDEARRARPCGVCGRAFSGGLCEVCGNERAARAGVEAAVELAVAVFGDRQPVGFEAEVRAGLEARVEERVAAVVAQGATALTGSLLRKLAAEEELGAARREVLEYFRRGEQAGAEAESASAALLRRWHLHRCHDGHDCRADAREQARVAGERARQRAAEYLLEKALVALRARRSAPASTPGELDPYRVGAARVRAAISNRPRAGVLA